MPTVFREGPYRVYFFSNEGSEPPHVHVDAGGATAKFLIRPVAYAGGRGFAKSELRRIRRILESHEDEALAAWNAHFGRR
jgi:hypothetical protein